jgi:hypothetical protein
MPRAEFRNYIRNDTREIRASMTRIINVGMVIAYISGMEEDTMTLAEIKQALSDGKHVYLGSKAYEVIHDSIGQYLIHCVLNDYYFGLTHRDGITLNGREDQFFVA